jgi:hypothetical protein
MHRKNAFRLNLNQSPQPINFRQLELDWGTT